MKKEKIIEVDIEKGAPDKKRYIFQGESDEIPGALPGDVFVEITIQKNPRLIRLGADLICNVNINLYEALTGFTYVFEHLDKKKIIIKSREGEKLSHGMIKTVKDLGMPFFESSHKFGNLYLRINVLFPERLEPCDKKALLDLLSEGKTQVITTDFQEKYYTTDFIQSEENTHHSGGRKEDKRHGDS